VITQIEKKTYFLYSSVEKLRSRCRERQEAKTRKAVEYHKGSRTKTLENAARRARKSSKEKQTRVGTIQKALRCALSLYPQQVLHPSTEADISTLN
jgi:hypothetical protein